MIEFNETKMPRISPTYNNTSTFMIYQGNDLYDVEKVSQSYQEVRVKKQDTLREVLQSLSSQLNVPPQKMRIWPMNHRTNQTLRPSLIDTEGDLDKAMIEGNRISYQVIS